MSSKAQNEMVDLTPVVIETSDLVWSPNTTPDVTSDIYVATQGSNTIVRIHQGGTVVSIRRVELAGG